MRSRKSDIRIQPTYEELKPIGTELHLALKMCIQPTYEELKRNSLLHLGQIAIVSSLPMRN